MHIHFGGEESLGESRRSRRRR